MRLYGYWRSSSTWRVRIALAHKGLDAEMVAVHLRDGVQRSAEHTLRNPLQQVPVLELPDGRRLTQSVAMLEWLEQTHPQPALLPKDPFAAAQVRQAVEIINSGIQPLQNFKILGAIQDLGGDRMAWGRQVIHDGFVALEALCAATAAQHLIGDSVSFADVCLVPQVYNARRFSVDLAPFPTLSRVEAHCMSLPAFQRSHPDAQPDAE
ncbi:MAG: maleylacetoacetate isomerase [Myxococcota bacterium]